MKKTFFVTTPIYYWNWVPHIWHAYSSVIADIIYKYEKISWKDVRFTTWIDENSQKAVLKAKEEWMEIMDYLDLMASKHKEVWDKFWIRYTDFIRTTESRHHRLVQEVLQKCYDSWDIYEWVYEWMYCVGCEAFKKKDDLIEKDWKLVCPDHLKEPEQIKEKNYFFKLSKYQTWIEEFYEKNPDFVKPDFRFNEVKSFVKWWLEDFSISRETNTFWIPLPFDNKQVTYVWFDALFNYYTSCKYSRWWDKNNENFVDEAKEFWEENSNKLHIVWKDIIRFHAIFWPCMLASYFGLWETWKDLKLHYKDSDRIYLPTTILTTWYFTVDWQKMSKSLGNVIEPVEYINTYSKDLLILYILSTLPIWLDWDYDKNQAIITFNARLANNLWNLLNRVIVLWLKIWGELKNANSSNFLLKQTKTCSNPNSDECQNSWVSEFAEKENYSFISKNLEWKITLVWWDILWHIPIYLEDVKKLFNEYNLKWVLDKVFEFCDILNNYTTKEEPWKMISEWNTEEAEKVLYIIAEWLRNIAILLYPFFTEKMSEMLLRLWLEDYPKLLEQWKMEELLARNETFIIKEKWEPLYMRI